MTKILMLYLQLPLDLHYYLLENNEFTIKTVTFFQEKKKKKDIL